MGDGLESLRQGPGEWQGRCGQNVGGHAPTLEVGPILPGGSGREREGVEISWERDVSDRWSTAFI